MRLKLETFQGLNMLEEMEIHRPFGRTTLVSDKRAFLRHNMDCTGAEHQGI